MDFDCFTDGFFGQISSAEYPVYKHFARPTLWELASASFAEDIVKVDVTLAPRLQVNWGALQAMRCYLG